MWYDDDSSEEGQAEHPYNQQLRERLLYGIFGGAMTCGACVHAVRRKDGSWFCNPRVFVVKPNDPECFYFDPRPA